jgi:hypothetical protein
MTHTGVLATILSGLEPAVAIVLACIPLMRPLLGKRDSCTNSSTYDYNSNKSGGVYSKKDCRSADRNTLTFTELMDDNDDSSEIHLQPMKGVQEVSVTTEPVVQSRRESISALPSQAITVEKRWEVRHDQCDGQ